VGWPAAFVAIVCGAGGLGLLVSTFLPWFGVFVKVGTEKAVFHSSTSDSGVFAFWASGRVTRSAWETLDWLPIFLVVVAVAGLACAWCIFRANRVWSRRPASLTALAAAFGLGWTVYRADHPPLVLFNFETGLIAAGCCLTAVLIAAAAVALRPRYD
jgi:hypothetical protein